MILVNTDYITGKKFEMIGLVKGNMIKSVLFGKDLVNSFKTLVGGELTSYTEMMNDARAIATKLMSEEAEKCGADLVIIETMSDTLEAKAAVLAVKENTSLPIFCTMTFDESYKTLTGGDVKVMSAIMEGLGVD